MSKLPILLIVFLLLPIISLTVSPSEAQAGKNISCVNSTYREYITDASFNTTQERKQPFIINVIFNMNRADPNYNYFIQVTDNQPSGISIGGEFQNSNVVSVSGQTGNYNANFNFSGLDHLRTFQVVLYKSTVDWNFVTGQKEKICELGTFIITYSQLAQAQCSITMPANVKNHEDFKIIINALEMASNLNIIYKLFIFETAKLPSNLQIRKVTEDFNTSNQFRSSINIQPPSTRVDYNNSQGTVFDNKNYTALVAAQRDRFFFVCDRFDFQVSNSATTPLDQCNIVPPNPTTSQQVKIQLIGASAGVNYSSYLVAGGDMTDTKTADSMGNASLWLGHGLAAGSYTATVYDASYDASTGDKFCEKTFQVSASPPPGDGVGGGCTGADCTTAGGEYCDAARTQLKTAVGCLPVDTNSLLQNIVKLFLGMAGGVALLLMITGSIQMITSQGNPESLKGGRDRFTSAAIGLLFIILSVTILEIIGVDILSLPGFGR